MMEIKTTHLPLALITGSGHRLGREIAINLGKLGYAIAIHYNSSRDRAEETLGIISTLNVPAYLLQADLTQEDQISQLFDQIKSYQHSLKILVNSAGVMFYGNLITAARQTWDKTMDINLRAVWLCSRLAYLQMKDQGGNIINISDSGAGRIWTGYPAYSISKAAVNVLTRLMAKTFAPNVRVNTISPGLIMQAEDMDQETWDDLVNKLPLKKQGEAAHINDGINFLLRNDYVTGQTIVIDGGYQLV